MKRVCLFLVALALLICSTAVPAHAAETVASGSAGESINWVLTDDGTLTLSGYGEMEFNGYRADAEKDFEFYQYRSRIKSIVIEEGITSISNFAFYNYGSYITSVSLPDSLISIGDGAFYNALKAVTSIRLPSQLQTIGASAFRGMGNLVSITIPASVVSIGARAFAECSKLVSVVFLSDTPPVVSNSIFESYKVLSRIMVPGGSVSAYQQAEYMTEYAGFITDGLPDPNAFTVLTSWADQHIYLDSDEQVNLYFIADGVNGSVSVDWYVNGQLFESFSVNNRLDNDTVIGGYYFDPGSDGTRTLYAVVHNTIGSNVESVTTSSCTIVSGQGTGSGSTDSDRFDQIDVELTEVKDAISEVNGKVDGISDQLDGVSDQIEESNGLLGDVVDGVLSLPGKILDGIVGLFVPDADAMAAQQEKWTQLLADRFGAVYEAGEIVTEITDVFTLQDTQTQIQFPSVTIPFGDVDWTFGGWMVDVVPDGFEFLIEFLKKILDIVCTLAFVNAMKNRFDRVLEEKT